MTPLQTAEVRAGEIRIRLSELAAETELTPEYRSELDTLRLEYTDTERKLAAPADYRAAHHTRGNPQRW